jgi:16S rRNA (adenine1518-N6/adenine1519-N6)-dimethyltransferase
MSRPKLGQHWLADKHILRKTAEEIKPSLDETCIEIGGGKGALSRMIAPLFHRLIVYEIDPKWAAHLRKYGPGWSGNIEVRETDALRIVWSRDELGLQKNEPLVITGNLPYYLTSPLLLRIAYSNLDFRRALFLIQKEVAERITAKPKDTEYGRLTVSLGAFLESKKLFNVRPESFKPRPKVMSTLIQMTRHESPFLQEEDVDLFEKTVQVAFHMRRKMLKNNLLAGFPEVGAKRIGEILSCIGIPPNARAQEVGIQDFVTLTRMLKPDA